MARIRTIKPEFFTSEDIVCMTPLARLFYVALWCEADREGRLEWKPLTFKMRYLPGDQCDVSQVAQELIERGLVILYKADGRQYAEIPTFTEHQVINNRESDSSIPPRTEDNTVQVRNLSQEMRQSIITRDGDKCLRCGATDDLTVDHIFPQSMGGTHNPKNLRCLCRTCNSARPVAGEALIADLARDGFTLNDMSKICFDASPRVKAARQRVKAEGKEGKGKEGKERALLAGFVKFWNTWPASERKQDKKDCAEKWEREGLEELTDQICADVESKKETQKWKDGFVEMPITYLNNRRWEDGSATDSTPWHERASGVNKMSEELGLPPQRYDEHWPVFKARVMKAHAAAQLTGRKAA